LFGLVLELREVSVVLHLFSFEILDLADALVDFFGPEDAPDSPADHDRQEQVLQFPHLFEEWHLGLAHCVAPPGFLNYCGTSVDVRFLQKLPSELAVNKTITDSLSHVRD